MSAQVLVKAGKDFKLQLEQLRMPTPGDGEVLIKTKASDADTAAATETMEFRPLLVH